MRFNTPFHKRPRLLAWDGWKSSYEKSLYGDNVMHAYSCEHDYKAKLKAAVLPSVGTLGRLEKRGRRFEGT
jgi:hypothetical protein